MIFVDTWAWLALAHKRDPYYARLVAERYGTEHHECVMDAEDLARELPAVVRHLDQPFAGVISSFWLSRSFYHEIRATGSSLRSSALVRSPA